MKKLSVYLLGLLVGFAIISCSNETEELEEPINQEPELLKGLEKADGVAQTYSYDFHITSGREELNFYVPIDIEQALAHLPKQMNNNIGRLNADQLPFDLGTAKANIVTSWNKDHQIQYQVQISYLENSESYNSNNKSYFIVSVTQCSTDPFGQGDFFENMKEALSDRYDVTMLPDDHPLFHKNKTLNMDVVYQFYHYKKDKNQINLTVTGAHQFYAWYNGLIFHIGYAMDTQEVDPEQLARKVILGNNISE